MDSNELKHIFGYEKRNGKSRSVPTRLYRIYTRMKSRCNNSNDHTFCRYGARGITVCREWENSFQLFAQWAYNNGYSELLTIERVDNNGNYEPGNCRWATYKEQSNNTRANHFIECDGKRKTLSQWADEVGITQSSMFSRLFKGWSERKAVTTPKTPIGHGRKNNVRKSY